MAKQQWIFKAYSGIHLGAEVALGAGEYVVGSGYGCDVIIDDSSLAARHFLLKVSEDGFEWKPVAEAVESNGGSDSEEGDDDRGEDGQAELASASGDVAWRAIAPYEIVSVGAFRFAYGIVGGAWPSLRSDEKQLSADSVDVDVPHEHSESTSELVQEDVELSEFEDDVSDGFGRKGGVWFPWVSAAVIALGVMLWVVADSGSVEQSGLTSLEKALAVVQEKRLTGLRVTARSDSFSGDEIVRVSGFVNSAAEKSMVEEALRENDVNAEMDVVSADVLKTSVELLAKRYKFPSVEFERGADPGTLIARGYIADAEKWKAFKSKVDTDVPRLGQLVDQVDTQARRFDQLKRMIRRYGLEGQIDVWQGKGEFVVSPSVNPEMRKEWSRLVQDYYRRFGSQPPIRQEVVIVEGFDVRSVSLGSPPYVVMSNGQKVIEGAKLQNGYMIHRIDQKEVVLRRDGKFVVYPIESGVDVVSPTFENNEHRELPESNDSKKDVTENYFIS